MKPPEAKRDWKKPEKINLKKCECGMVMVDAVTEEKALEAQSRISFFMTISIALCIGLAYQYSPWAGLTGLFLCVVGQFIGLLDQEIDIAKIASIPAADVTKFRNRRKFWRNIIIGGGVGFIILSLLKLISQ